LANTGGETVTYGPANSLLRTRSVVWVGLLVLVPLVVNVILGLNFAGVTRVWDYAGPVAIVGLVVGVLIGSPQARPWKRGVNGFAVGCLGTVCATVISFFAIASFERGQFEVILLLVALIAVVFGLVTGGACALGSLLGGVLRGRPAGNVRPT
jgi:hypothetical protein